MRTAFRRTGVVAVVVSMGLCHPGFAYTQAQCDQLKKIQTDGAGRQIDAKMQVDAKGNCKQEPPNEKTAKVPTER